MNQAFIFFSWKMICPLTSLANSIVRLSRRAPPFNSPEDSAPDHQVELEIQRQYMNANNQDLPGEIQNLCVGKEAAQEERDPSTTSISHCHRCLTILLLFFPSSASSSLPPPPPTAFPPALLFFASSSLFSLYLQPDFGSITGEVTGIALLSPFCVFFRPRRGLVTWIHVGNICQLCKDEQSIPTGDKEECPGTKGTSFLFSSSLTLNCLLLFEQTRSKVSEEVKKELSSLPGGKWTPWEGFSPCRCVSPHCSRVPLTAPMSGHHWVW